MRESVFVLNRLNSIWSARVIRNLKIKIRKNKSDIERQLATNLREPKSGWENFWQKLIDEEILTLSTGENDRLGRDTWRYIIETKVKNEHRFFHFWSPSEKDEIEESRQIAKIFNLIAEEFNIPDLKAY